MYSVSNVAPCDGGNLSPMHRNAPKFLDFNFSARFPSKKKKKIGQIFAENFSVIAILSLTFPADYKLERVVA
jgi:hypothetical protein